MFGPAAAVTQLGFDCAGSDPRCVLVCLCLYTDLCAFIPGTLVYLSVNLLNIWSPLVALSVHADCLSWEPCFIFLAYISFPHMIATFPFFFCLFSRHPRFQKLQKRRPHFLVLTYFLLWHLEGLLCLSFWSSWSSISSIGGLIRGGNVGNMPDFNS